MAAISREQADNMYYRIDELKNQTTKEVMYRALGLNKGSKYSEITNLLSEGYASFASKVHHEFDQTPFEDVASMLISSYKTFFFYQLKKDIA